MEDTSSNLRAFLALLEMSPKQLARNLDVSQSALGHWITGRRTMPKDIMSVVDYCCNESQRYPKATRTKALLILIRQDNLLRKLRKYMQACSDLGLYGFGPVHEIFNMLLLENKDFLLSGLDLSDYDKTMAMMKI